MKNRRKVILDLRETRWSMRQESYSHFYASFIFIVKALEVFACGLHKNEISDMFNEISDMFKDPWGSSPRARASFILNMICTFNFLITVFVLL